MDEFDLFWELMSPRAQKWVLSGRMTLEEALYLTEHDEDTTRPVLTEAQVDACMVRTHGKQREKLLRRCPGIGEACASKSELVEELLSMPDRVQCAFLEGRLTFTQARYATARGFRGVVLTQFLQIGAKEGRTSVNEKTRNTFATLREGLARQVRQQAYLKELLAKNILQEDMASKFAEYGTPIEHIQLYVAGYTGVPYSRSTA